VRELGSSELKRKVQAALPDSQITDSKVPATSAVNGENLTEAAQIADMSKGCCEDLYHDKDGKGIDFPSSLESTPGFSPSTKL